MTDLGPPPYLSTKVMYVSIRLCLRQHTQTRAQVCNGSRQASRVIGDTRVVEPRGAHGSRTKEIFSGSRFSTNLCLDYGSDLVSPRTVL